MRYCFDIDGTLCHTPNKVNGKPDYHNAIPPPDRDWETHSTTP